MSGPTSRYGGYPPPRIPVGNIDGNIPGSKISDVPGSKISGDIADENVPGVRTTVNNIANKIFGWESGERTHQESADALESIRFQMASNTSQIQTILSTQTSGVMALDDFNRDGSHLGQNWWQSWTGADFGYSCRTANGGEAYCNVGTATPYANTLSGSFNRIYIWQGNNPVSLTEYQDVAVLLNSGMKTGGYNSPSAANDVICRWSSNASYVRFRALQTRGSAARWELHYFINGTANQVATGNLPSNPAPGSLIRIKAGDKETNNPRKYQTFWGSQQIYEWNDPGVSAVGASNRGYGFSIWSNPVTVLFDRYFDFPASLDQWQAKDQ